MALLILALYGQIYVGKNATQLTYLNIVNENRTGDEYRFNANAVYDSVGYSGKYSTLRFFIKYNIEQGAKNLDPFGQIAKNKSTIYFEYELYPAYGDISTPFLIH